VIDEEAEEIMSELKKIIEELLISGISFLR